MAFFLSFVVSLFVMFIGVAGWMVGWQNSVQTTCLAAGYPAIRTTFSPLQGYCVRRVNQTDEVVTVESIRK